MPDEAERVVFDCVVYAQAIINPDGPAGRCLELARGGALSLCVSDYLLIEIRELPEKLAPRLRITSQKVEEFVTDLLAFARHIAIVPDVYKLEPDPDDSHYINLALAADALIVTSRDRDLLDLMNESFPEGKEFTRRFPQLKILTPEERLEYAQQLMKLRFTESDHARMALLSDKAQEGTLSPAEQDALDDYINLSHLLTLVHSKARLLVKRRRSKEGS